MKMKFLLLLLCAVDLSQGDFATSPVSNSAFEFDHEWYVSKQEFRYLDREFVKRNTRFFIWTRDNPNYLKELKLGDRISLERSGYRKLKPTKIFIHGFTNNGHSHHTVIRMRDEYLKRGDYNFITVDWENVAMAPFYIRAVINSEVVGELTGKFINFLVEQGADLNQFHVIGFSLGAHVAGKAGATVNGLLPRITGLDPAYPFYSWQDTEQRLDWTDAKFVDVIHTNSGFLVEGAVGFPMPIGHVDFYPNGGYSQPGCIFLKAGGIFDLLKACSHLRAPEYFIESINSPVGFKAVQCDSWDHFISDFCVYNTKTLMGEPISPRTRGNFYLVTNKRSSFAVNMYH